MRIVEGRYVLTNDPFREGGMSTVAKAFDPKSNRFCAIKRMKGSGGEDIRWKESFNREYAALSELSQHQNIVALLDAGTDDDGFFMVLEWVSENLVDRINASGALNWHEFYHGVGRPILGALSYAQGRGWNHRDVKPQNILIDDNGTPKLSDYGIAKQFEKPSLGLTFSQFRSVPFTPPEDDGGERSCSRDCFSWAAVAVYCLTGRTPADYSALAEMVASLDQSSVPVAILQTALSHDPAERHPLASALLADLDAVEAKSAAMARPAWPCHIRIEPDCLRSVLRTIDRNDPKDAETFILEELNEIEVGLKVVPGSEGGTDEILRISAVTWTFEAHRSSMDAGYWSIRRARPGRAADVERYRELCFRAPLRFTFATPQDPITAIEEMRELLLQIEVFEHERREIG